MKRDEQSWRPERRKGGAAGKFLRLGHSKQLDPPPSEGARKGIPLHLSGWGGVGTPGLSHCQNPRQRNLFVSVWWAWASYLLPPGRNKGQKAITAWAVAGHTSPVPPPPPAHWLWVSPRHCWSLTLLQHWGAVRHSFDFEGWTELPSSGSWVA